MFDVGVEAFFQVFDQFILLFNVTLSTTNLVCRESNKTEVGARRESLNSSQFSLISEKNPTSNVLFTDQPWVQIFKFAYSRWHHPQHQQSHTPLKVRVRVGKLARVGHTPLAFSSKPDPQNMYPCPV